MTTLRLLKVETTEPKDKRDKIQKNVAQFV